MAFFLGVRLISLLLKVVFSVSSLLFVGKLLISFYVFLAFPLALMVSS